MREGHHSLNENGFILESVSWLREKGTDSFKSRQLIIFLDE